MSQLLGDWVSRIRARLDGHHAMYSKKSVIAGLFWLILMVLGFPRTIGDNEPHLQILSLGHDPRFLSKTSRPESTFTVPRGWVPPFHGARIKACDGQGLQEKAQPPSASEGRL